MALKLDYTCLLAGGPQGETGVSADDLAAAEAAHGARLGRLRAQRAEGSVGFYDLPDERGPARAAMEYAESRRGHFENVVVLGIGGSALGTLALHAALSPPLVDHERGTTNRPRLFVVDNVDPVLVSGVLRTANPARSLFVVISKSGSTAETMSQFLLFLEALKVQLKDKWTEHVVVITDGSKGHLRPFADAHDLVSFTVPDNVGGRFSALSAVGLLPGACLGWDLEALLDGASAGRDACLRDDFRDNPAALYATTHHLLDTRVGCPIQVLFPYSHQLRLLADWQVQLVAESLGKRTADGVGVGPTPHKAVGATDQHSQVQLFAEGPVDKVFTFLRVLEHTDDVIIPEPPPGLEALDYLGGKSFAQLIDAECRATNIALVDAGRPCCAILFPRVSAATVGEYLMWMEVATAYGGQLYGVDAFDQPGVEAGKVATYGLMGRSGFEAEAARVSARHLSDAATLVG